MNHENFNIVRTFLVRTMPMNPGSCRTVHRLAVGAAIFLSVSSAQAYVGPSLGLGALAVVFGVIGSVFLAIFAIVWYPIKRLLKKKKASDGSEASKDDTTVTETECSQDEAALADAKHKQPRQ